MKMLLIAAALTFASYAHADQSPAPDQDMAASCQAEMDQRQELTPACEARLACLSEGIQDADCQTYCAEYPADTEACANQTANAEMSRRWHRHHRNWWRFCRRHPFAWQCRWH